MDVNLTHEQLVYALNHIHHAPVRAQMHEVVKLAGYGALLDKGIHAETQALNQTRARLNNYLDSNQFGQQLKQVAMVNPAELGLDEEANARVLSAKLEDLRQRYQCAHFGLGTQEEFKKSAETQRHQVALSSMVGKQSISR